MTRMVRLWHRNNAELYGNASKLMDNARLFEAAGLKKVVRDQLKEPLAKEQGLANNPVYQYIMRKRGDYTIEELSALRSTVNNSRSGSLVGDVTDRQLKGLADKLDDMFTGAELRINEIIELAKANRLTYEVLGMAPPSGRPGAQLGFKVGGEELLTPQEAARVARQFADGLDKFKSANLHYEDGAKIFKTGAMNMLNQNIKEGFFADMSAVVEAVVQNNRPQLLRNYLKGVTPDETIRGTMQSIPSTQWSAMATAARQGNITEVNRLLGANFPELAGGKMANKTLKKIGLAFKPPKFLETLPQNDPYRKRILGELAETFQLHADDAAAAASGTAHKNISRQALASTWIKTVAQQSDDLGVFDPAAFRRSFDALGKEVQTELFGATEAKRLNAVLKDFSLVAPDQIKRGFRFESVAPGSITNSNMRNIVQNLQADVAEAQVQSTSALFQAVKTGRIVNADDMIQAAVKDPKLLDDLIRRVPGDVLNEPYGLKDAAMSRIIREAFPKGITEEAVVSGAWKEGMAASINNLNQRGSLNKILGADTVRDLVKLTKLPVGDKALKGKGGLASSTYAAGIFLAILTNPVAALPSLAGVYLSGRILRNALFLKAMTRPTIRASELQSGIRALSDDILAKARADGVSMTRKQATEEAKKQLGNLSVLRRRFTELAVAEARIMSATKASESTGPEERRVMGEAASGVVDYVRPIAQDIRTQVPAVQNINVPGLPANAAAPAQTVSPSIQALRDQANPRVQAMQDLLGGQR